MKRKNTLPRIGLTLLAVLVLAGTAQAANLTWTNTISTTWDGTTTTHWNPAQVPVNGDSVFITNAFPTGVTVDYASGNFTGANAVNILRVGNATAGQTNTLLLGMGDTLQYYGSLAINAGGRVVVGTGATFAQTNVVGAQKFTVSGGALELTGGTITNGAEFHVSNGVYTQTAGTNTATYSMYLADGAGQNAILNVSGGRLVNNTYDFYARSGNSTLTLSGGEVIINRDAYVGTTGGNHTWTISGGLLRQGVWGSGGGDMSFGNSTGAGSVTVTQLNGVVRTTALRVNRTATYNLLGGIFTNGTLYLNGTVNQTGGTMYNDYESHIGTAANRTGVYNLVSGTLRNRGLHIGDVAGSVGTLTAHAGATLRTSYLGGGPNTVQTIAIGATSGAGSGNLVLKGLNGIGGDGFSHAIINQTGKLQGWGTLSGIEFGIMNGQVVADGFGTDRTLNLVGRVLTNTVNNALGENRGWYAQNKGKLLLAPFAVSAGSSTQNWGEATYANDPTLDLVNSAQLRLNNVSGSGTVTGALLAVDRTDIAGPPPPGYGFISVHEFTTNGTFTVTGFDLTIRYADALVRDDLEPLLALFQWNGTAWTNVVTSVDTVNKLITAEGLTSFGQFAVAMVPEPSALLLLGTGGWLVWRLRRRGKAGH